MGKYMKKSKITTDFTVMDVSKSTALGVRTRAKTLALQRLYSDDAYYLQLRSRRLEKPHILTEIKERRHTQVLNREGEVARRRENTESNPSSRLDVSSVNSVSGGLVGLSNIGEECCGPCGSIGKIVGVCNDYDNKEFVEYGNDVDTEASFGENNLDIEGRDRTMSTRESTPCSFIRDSDTKWSPASTTRQSSAAAMHRMARNNMQRILPAHELEEFFAYAEQQQRMLFIEKYNYDIVNDVPLPGRYEWVQVVP